MPLQSEQKCLINLIFDLHLDHSIWTASSNLIIIQSFTLYIYLFFGLSSGVGLCGFHSVVGWVDRVLEHICDRVPFRRACSRRLSYTVLYKNHTTAVTLNSRGFDCHTWDLYNPYRCMSYYYYVFRGLCVCVCEPPIQVWIRAVECEAFIYSNSTLADSSQINNSYL